MLRDTLSHEDWRKMDNPNRRMFWIYLLLVALGIIGTLLALTDDAEAHTPNVRIECQNNQPHLIIDLINYNGTNQITVDGASVTFRSSYHSNTVVAIGWHTITVRAHDDPYNKRGWSPTYKLEAKPCVKPTTTTTSTTTPSTSTTTTQPSTSTTSTTSSSTSTTAPSSTTSSHPQTTTTQPSSTTTEVVTTTSQDPTTTTSSLVPTSTKSDIPPSGALPTTGSATWLLAKWALFLVALGLLLWRAARATWWEKS